MWHGGRERSAVVVEHLCVGSEIELESGLLYPHAVVVIIAETPATPSARSTKALALIEIAEKFEALFPILIEDILELMDLPNRARVLQKFRATQQVNPAAGQPTGVPTNGGGTPDALAEAVKRVQPPQPPVPAGP